MGIFNNSRGDVPGKMKYKVHNDQYRDVYNQRDRKRNYKRKTGAHSKQWNFIISFVSAIGLILLECLVVAGVGHIIYQLMAMSGQTQWIPSYTQFIGDVLWPDPKWWWLLSLGAPFGAAYLMYFWLQRTSMAQNIRYDNSDLNQYTGDSRLVQPEEMAHNFDFFPDNGYHSDVDPTAILGHLHLTNQGLKRVDITKRYDRDTIIQYDDGFKETAYKDDPIRDDDGKIETQTVPLIDEAYSQDLYKSSLITKQTGAQVDYNPKLLLYKTSPDQLAKANFKTVAEKINADWEMPEYEVQRAGGIYIVDTDPNNTMVLAMTRAGKGDGPVC